MAVINILEDDEVIRGQLSQLLRDKGYEVIESADISSFNKIDSENTDLYLLDVYLPVLSILCVMWIIKKDERRNLDDL